MHGDLERIAVLAIEQPRLWCDACAEQGVASGREGSKCLLCGAEQWEPFMAGWDGSD